MVQRTPLLSLPYVEPADTPVTYPTISQELAQKLDAAAMPFAHGMTAQGIHSGAVVQGFTAVPLTTLKHQWGTVGTLTGGSIKVTRAGYYQISAAGTYGWTGDAATISGIIVVSLAANALVQPQYYVAPATNPTRIVLDITSVGQIQEEDRTAGTVSGIIDSLTATVTVAFIAA